MFSYHWEKPNEEFTRRALMKTAKGNDEPMAKGTRAVG